MRSKLLLGLVLGAFLFLSPLSAQADLLETGLIGIDVGQLLKSYGQPKQHENEGCSVPVLTDTGVGKETGQSFDYVEQDAEHIIVLRVCVYENVVVAYQKQFGERSRELSGQGSISFMSQALVQKLYELKVARGDAKETPTHQPLIPGKEEVES